MRRGVRMEGRLFRKYNVVLHPFMSTKKLAFGVSVSIKKFLYNHILKSLACVKACFSDIYIVSVGRFRHRVMYWYTRQVGLKNHIMCFRCLRLILLALSNFCILLCLDVFACCLRCISYYVGTTCCMLYCVIELRVYVFISSLGWHYLCRL